MCFFTSFRKYRLFDVSVITKDGDQTNEKLLETLQNFQFYHINWSWRTTRIRFEIQIFSFWDVKFLCQHDFIVMNLSVQLKWKRKENLKIFQSSIIRVPAEQRESSNIFKLLKFLQDYFTIQKICFIIL